MTTLTEIKASLAQIETSLGIPLESLEAILQAEKADLDNSIGQQIDDIKTEMAGLQDQLTTLQTEYDTEMESIVAIQKSRDMVEQLKTMLGAV